MAIVTFSVWRFCDICDICDSFSNLVKYKDRAPQAIHRPKFLSFDDPRAVPLSDSPASSSSEMSTNPSSAEPKAAEVAAAGAAAAGAAASTGAQPPVNAGVPSVARPIVAVAGAPEEKKDPDPAQAVSCGLSCCCALLLVRSCAPFERFLTFFSLSSRLFASMWLFVVCSNPSCAHCASVGLSRVEVGRNGTQSVHAAAGISSDGSSSQGMFSAHDAEGQQ